MPVDAPVITAICPADADGRLRWCFRCYMKIRGVSVSYFSLGV